YESGLDNDYIFFLLVVKEIYCFLSIGVIVSISSNNKELEVKDDDFELAEFEVDNFELAEFEVDDSELDKLGKLGSKKKVIFE
ncbi:13631_t:CDS:2, partial [Dentiscutata heterogama]